MYVFSNQTDLFSNKFQKTILRGNLILKMFQKFFVLIFIISTFASPDLCSVSKLVFFFK